MKQCGRDFGATDKIAGVKGMKHSKNDIILHPDGCKDVNCVTKFFTNKNKCDLAPSCE